MVSAGDQYLSNLRSVQITYEQWYRYLIATQFVKGKDVVDIARGEGYGANLLAHSAKSVTGIDVSCEVITSASDRYRRSNLSFLHGSMENIPITGKKKIDVVVFFETLENLNDEGQDIFLKEVKRIIKDDGTFIVSIPNKLFYSCVSKYKNEFSIKKKYEQEFLDFLRKYFEHVIVICQKICVDSFLWNLDDSENHGPNIECHISNDSKEFLFNKKIKESFCLIAVCSDSKLNVTNNSFLLDNSLNLLPKHDTQISCFHQSIEYQKAQIKNHTQAIAERDEQIEKLNQLFLERESQIANLNKALVDRDIQIDHLVRERDLIFNSLSWRITKPLRFIRINIINKIFYLIRCLISITVRQVWRFFPLNNHQKLFVKGFFFHNFPFIFRWSSAYRGWAAMNALSDVKHSVTKEQNVCFSDSCAEEKKINKIKFHGSSSILFVGHDALLAGGQVLLLSLIKWISNNTSIVIKVILLNGGTLIDQYKDIVPTLIWNDIVNEYPEKDKRKEILREFIGHTDLIYGNTVLSATIYDELEYLKVPYITHVHELERSIKMYFDKIIIQKMHLYTDGYIAGSKPVKSNLILNHHGDRKKIALINDFIESRKINFDIPKKELRNKIGLPEDAFIVIGCGTVYWRKGVDLFIDTAIILKKKGVSNIHFYWIGENIWDLDHPSCHLCSWNTLKQKIKDYDLANHINFLGVKENFFEYVQASDVFYLPSREDPFPLVCLEAAQFRIPVICFEDAGGMTDFVEDDAGFVVPYEDVDEAAEKIIYLEKYPDISKRLGENASKKYLSQHSIDIAAPKIIEFCRKIGKLNPAVSIVVPNYNCEKYLEKRLNSILNQTFKDFEIILLDDCSTDKSLDILEKYLDYPNVKLIKNQANGGNPFLQWHKGFLQAKGDIIWFAEADDYCERNFLEKVLPSFNHPCVALAYCDSFMIDESNSIIGNYDSYLANLDTQHWKSSYHVSGIQEINFGLGIKNTIPNASAVLIRKSCISEEIFKKTFRFKFSGDWFFYTQVTKGKDIGFCCEKLNYHRKHKQTVTSRFNADKTAIQILIKEAELIHNSIIENYSISEEFLKKWQNYMDEQIHAFYPYIAKDDFNHYYQYTVTEDKIKKRIVESDKNKRLVFLTTNDGAPNGGSEQLWIETAMECQRRGHQAMVIIKDWHPSPYFIELFHNLDIKVIFKGHDEFNKILSFKPDLLIVSTGDQDEGIEWYDKCQNYYINYIIINQLTKEPEYWPIRSDINERVQKGYLGAEMVFFTCKNNHRVMENRLNCRIPNAAIHFNPFHIDRDSFVPFPAMNDGLKIAIPANLLRVHKGQHMAIELFSLKKWRERPIQLNLYGEGSDEKILKTMASDYGLKNVFFHKPTNNLLTIWRHNHAIFMPSFMEGLPVVLVSAMICARVPILTDIGGHREIVDDNINGFIAEKPTVEALDEALERAYHKSEMWEIIGKKARERILSFLPPDDPVDDFISKIIPLANKRKSCWPLKSAPLSVKLASRGN